MFFFISPYYKLHTAVAKIAYAIKKYNRVDRSIHRAKIIQSPRPLAKMHRTWKMAFITIFCRDTAITATIILMLAVGLPISLISTGAIIITEQPELSKGSLLAAC